MLLHHNSDAAAAVPRARLGRSNRVLLLAEGLSGPGSSCFLGDLVDLSEKKEILTVGDLALYWGVTRSSVHRAALRGTIPGCHKDSPTGDYYFDKEVVLAEWVPPRLKSWAENLRKPGALIAGTAGLRVEEGKKALQDAAIARLHDLHILVSSEDWSRIITAAVDQAVEGDWRARKWLGDYLMGPPVQRVEAEIEVKTKQSFSDEMRSQAIQALLEQARERVTVDVESKEKSESGSDTNREVSSRLLIEG